MASRRRTSRYQLAARFHRRQHISEATLLTAFGGRTHHILVYYHRRALRAYDLDCGTRIWDLGLLAIPHSIAFRPESDTLAIDRENEVLLLDGNTGREC